MADGADVAEVTRQLDELKVEFMRLLTAHGELQHRLAAAETALGQLRKFASRWEDSACMCHNQQPGWGKCVSCRARDALAARGDGEKP